MIERYSTDIATAFAALDAAPMSRKAAMLLVLLIDREIDRRFVADGADDRLVFRAGVAAESEALALVLELAAMRDGGARLVLEPVTVPLGAIQALSEPDYMVSLYNDASVPRVLIARGDERHDALDVLRRAVASLDTRT